MSNRKLFAVHPGIVYSALDGQRHYINADALARLYDLQPGEYIIWDDQRPYTFVGRDAAEYRHLYPSASGQYGRPRDEG